MSSDLNKYQPLREIARGVYVGEHPRIERLVTLRPFPTDGDGSKAFSELIGIARRLSQVDHPNLAHLYDVEIDDRSLTLVMECASGNTLRRIVQEDGPRNAYIAARYCRQVADAMDHAHHLRLAHGQLKPESIYVSDQQAIKIVGLGACLGEPTSLEDEKFDVATDVAALGQVLSFCLVGDDSSSDERSVTKQQSGGGEETPELLRIARRAELRGGENAIGTAKEFKHALDQWIQRHSRARAIPWDEGLPAESTRHRVSPQASLAKSDSGRRKLALIIAGVAVLLLLTPGLAYFLMPSSEDEQSILTDRKQQESPASHKRADPKRRASSNELPSLAQASVFHREEVPEHDEASERGEGPERDDEPKRDDERRPEAASTASTPLRGEGNTADREDAPDQRPPVSVSADDLETTESLDEAVVGNPFRNLPNAASLPSVLDETQFSLGPLAPVDHDVLAVNLLGGDTAVWNGQGFEVIQGPHAATWTVRQTSARSTGELSVEIAEIWVAESKLLFRWVAQAKAERACNGLRNCLIELRCGEHGHIIRLRQTQVIDPLIVNLEKNVRRVPVDWAPVPQQLLFQLLASNGDPTLSESVVPASSGEIVIGDGPAQPGVWINLTVEFRRRLEVTAVPWIRIEPGKRSWPLTPGILKQSVKNAQNQILRVRQQLTQIGNRTQKAALKASIPSHEARLQQLERLGEACQAIQDRPLHFRLFHQVGPHQVELVRTRVDAVQASENM